MFGSRGSGQPKLMVRAATKKSQPGGAETDLKRAQNFKSMLVESTLGQKLTSDGSICSSAMCQKRTYAWDLSDVRWGTHDRKVLVRSSLGCGLHALHHLIDREASRFLPWWKLLEAFEELGNVACAGTITNRCSTRQRSAMHYCGAMWRHTPSSGIGSHSLRRSQRTARQPMCKWRWYNCSHPKFLSGPHSQE